MKLAVSSSYNPPDDTSGAPALANLQAWIASGIKLEEGRMGLGFPFMYLLLTGTIGIKVGLLFQYSNVGDLLEGPAVRTGNGS